MDRTTHDSSGRDRTDQDRAGQVRADQSRVVAHVAAFNRAVTAGDWADFAARFAQDARMSFVGVPAGPYVDRPAIAQAYAENPPTDGLVAAGKCPGACATGRAR